MDKLKFLAFASILIFCVLYFTPPSFAQDKLVAIVNNETITQKDLNDFLNFARMQFSKDVQGKELESKIQSMRMDLLNKLIEDRLMVQEAKKSGITADENRVKAKIDEIKKRYLTDEQFQNDLSKQGLVQADLETRIREQLLMYAVVDAKIRVKIVVRPDEVTVFYNNDKSSFVKPEEREVEIITLENQDQAKSFSYNLKMGDKLGDLAVRYPVSVDKIRATKGKDLRKEIEDKVFVLNINEISDPVEMDGKFYVFRITGITPSRQLSLSEAQDDIHNMIFEQKMQAELSKWLDELRKQAYIKILQN